MGFIKVFSVCLLLTVCSELPAQNRKYQISGVVVDSLSGQPMPGVSIRVVGVPGGGVTNLAGEFTMLLQRLPSNLYFSYVGYSIGSYLATKSGEKGIRIVLLPETRQIGEVTVSGQKITKVMKGDTLNVIEYEIDGDRIIAYASPYKNTGDLRIYLTTLTGENLDDIKVSQGGKAIKHPEKMDPETEFLIRDYTGQVNFLDKNCAHEVRHEFDRLTFGFDTPYADFIGRVMPIKCEMAGQMVFQVSTLLENLTWFFGRGNLWGKPLKIVKDKFGDRRYIHGNKCVSAPIFRKGNELYIFDFFSGHIEIFNLGMITANMVPIDFQYKEVTEGLVFHYKDVDTYNFTQTILFDEVRGRAYAFFKMRDSGRQSLREVNLETGKIIRTIDIPDFSNISNIRVYDNAVYFLYDTRVYPYYRLLYRMVI